MRFEKDFGLRFTDTKIFHGNISYDRALVERIIQRCSQQDIKNVVIDAFCGMGGVTAGFMNLPGWSVIACINHWPVAIETHRKNFPDCLHLLEDFRFADIMIIEYMLWRIKKNNPFVKVHGWFSFECTNYSGAKGGKSRDADSRTLADDLDKYVLALDMDVIWVENVREFKLWGPMIPKVVVPVGRKNKTVQFNPEKDDESIFIDSYAYCPLTFDNKTKTYTQWNIPDKSRLGEDFKRWKKRIISYGYDKNVGERLLNCADYGIPQHRIRLIMQFNREGISPVFPSPTHDKKGRGGLKKWNPVKPCLDLEEEGEDVLSFNVRKSGSKKGELVPRIKSPKTIERLINGCNKHVLNGENETIFLTKFLSNNPNTFSNSGASVNETSPCLNTQGRIYPTKVQLIDHYFGNGYMKSVDNPIGVTGTRDGAALYTQQFLSTYYSVGDGSKLDQPSQAMTTKDKHPLVTVNKFIDHQYSQGQQNKSIQEPSGAILNVPKQKVVSVDRFLMDTQFNNGDKSLDNVSGTITANRKHFYLVNFQWFNKCFKTVESPANTIIARQDKSPNYLITLETGEVAIEVYDYDPPHYVKMKKYMAENGIIGIKMRMLKENEMLKIMTIPDGTKMSRSSTDNKKMIGNAVPSELVCALGRAYDQQNNFEMLKTA